MSVSVVRAQRKALLGRKVGMTQVYNADDDVIPVTVIEAGPCTVLQVKTEEKDGYASLRVGFQKTTKRSSKPQAGLFRSARVSAQRFVREVPLVEPAHVGRVALRSEVGGTVDFADLSDGETLFDRKIPKSRQHFRVVIGPAPADESESEGEEAESEAGGSEASGPQPRILVKDSSGKVLGEYPLPYGATIEVDPGATVADGDVLAYVPAGEGAVEEIEPGMQIGVELFEGIAKVDVSGVTKGRGYQGVVRRHNFNCGDKSHGSKNVRMVGTTGMGTDPGRVFKGNKMPGQMGQARRKARGLEVIEIDRLRNLLLVKGSVPGADGSLVIIQESFIR